MKPEDLQPISKEQYYNQQLLKVEDFQREQNFHIAYRDLQTRLLYTPGVLIGLDVTLDATKGLVTIGPGLAINSLGRQIILVNGAVFDDADVLPTSVGFTIDVSHNQSQNVTLLLTIEYNEESDSSNPNQWKVFPMLALTDTATGKAAVTQVSLATITIATSGPKEKPVVDYKLDTSVRASASLVTEQQNINADQIISGTLDAARIPDLDAEKITSGLLNVDLIPHLPISKLGKLEAGNIPDLSADKITSGTLIADRIPELSADKISSDVLKIERIPDIPSTKVKGPLDDSQIPALKAEQITSGTFDVARIPDISKLTGKLSINQLPDSIPTEGDLLSIDVEKPNINGEETVTLSWNDTSADEIHLEYIDEDKIVEKIWKATAGIAKGWTLTPYQTGVYTLTAYKAGEIQTRGQFTIQVIPILAQYIKSLYYQGTALSDALQLCVTRYQLSPLTMETTQSTADAAQATGYSRDEALNILKTYPQKISELATPVITSFTNDKNDFIIQWNTVPDADSYELNLDSEVGPKLVKPDGNAKEFTFTSTTPPSPGNYSVRMRAVAGDVYSQWSDTKSLNIPEPKALQHHWAFDESSGTVAIDAVGNVNGTLTASVTRESPGCIGSGAVHIDGSNDSYVTFGTKIGQFKTDDFCVALWFKTTETLKYFDIVGNRTDGSHGNFFCLRMTGQHESRPWGMLVAEVDQDGNGTNYAAAQSSRTGLNDGNWHHAAVVRSGQSLKLYVDGSLSAQATGSDVASISNGNDFKLGRSLAGVSDRFAPNASYDELWVYDSALSADEVSNLFNAKDTGGGGKSLFFNGQAFAEMNYVDPAYTNNSDPNNLMNPINNGFTIEAMVYLTREIVDSIPVISAFLPDGSEYLNDGPSLCLSIDNSQLTFTMTTYTWNSGMPFSPQQSVLKSEFNIPPYQWVHLAVTHDNQGSVVLYVNGNSWANIYFGTSMPNFSHYFLGKVGNNFFTGFIKEVRLWRGARTAEDILKYSKILLGNQSPNFIPQGLGAYYQLIEGEGAVAKDSIKNNDFQLTNTSWEIPTR
jgi:hypothetical protein